VVHAPSAALKEPYHVGRVARVDMSVAALRLVCPRKDDALRGGATNVVDHAVFKSGWYVLEYLQDHNHVDAVAPALVAGQIDLVYKSSAARARIVQPVDAKGANALVHKIRYILAHPSPDIIQRTPVFFPREIDNCRCEGLVKVIFDFAGLIRWQEPGASGKRTRAQCRIVPDETSGVENIFWNLAYTTNKDTHLTLTLHTHAGYKPYGVVNPQ